MTTIERAQILKQLMRASDATHEAARLAAYADQSVLAARLRNQVHAIGDIIHDVGDQASKSTTPEMRS